MQEALAVGEVFANARALRMTIGINWKTVGIGIGTTAVGAFTIAGSVIAGEAAGGPVGVYAAGGGITTGITLWGLGWGDVANGLNGRESVLYETLKELYSPGLEDAINPF